ncbi:30S ribosomal protein S4 [Candidatus Woesearchaeota archaeon]|nr:30S ribosomal protein S4 [Candidatus Woesearchaeota archaeon]
MGDPKKQKKKYRKPLMIWNEERIARDKDLIKNFGLKNKKEIWKIESELKLLHDQAKKLVAQNTEQSKKESEQLIRRLTSLNLIQQDAKLDNILSLTIQDLLNRRLQTLVFKKELAKTINQARQFITHNHIAINSQIINVPSYLVPLKEEALINFNQYSSLANTDHPERIELKLGKKLKPEEELKEIKVAEEKEEQPETKSEAKSKAKLEKAKKGKKKSKKEGELEQTPEERKTHKEK